MEEIEYSTDCPTLKGSDLDSDVNKNMAAADEDGFGDGDDDGTQQLSSRSRLFPQPIRQGSVETLREKRNLSKRVNGQITV